MFLNWKYYFVFVLHIAINVGKSVENITFHEWQFKQFSQENHFPTQGEVWPKPFYEKKQLTTYVFPSNITFKVIDNDCRLIQKAIQRFQKYIDILSRLKLRLDKKNSELNTSSSQETNSTLNEIIIDLSYTCDKGYPQLDMDESYRLEVSESSKLESSSVWGIIRGLETMSQLVYLSNDFTKIIINGTYILDRPQYSHRGLLLDTGRHYFSVKDIMKILDAMAMDKMNVFHWHIFDDQSFPYQSHLFPELSKKGAFNDTMIYTQDDIEILVEYARDRGIRILLETDVPGHSLSLIKSHPEIFPNNCLSGLHSTPMDPISEDTYKLLKGLIKEMQTLFPDKHFHLGGDEVHAGCWLTNKKINTYLKEHKANYYFDQSKSNKSSRIIYPRLMNTFIRKVVAFLRFGTTPVFWEDQFRSQVQKLPKNSVVQCWVNSGTTAVYVLRNGLKVIQSAENNFYLHAEDRTFEDFYMHDPWLRVTNHLLVNGIADMLPKKNLIGGEACLWTENFTNDTLLNDFIWPRTSATAEVLWSYTESSRPNNHTLRRIHEHVCRKARRGISFTFPIKHCFI